MKITSSGFKEKGQIPSRYTCHGEGISPPLQISGVPSNAKSLVLIVEDPDVPKSLREDGMWDHWILFNIAPDIEKIEENEAPPCKMGMATSGNTTYDSFCPPDREHRYFFKLYALDIMLDLPEGASKKRIEKEMSGHILTKSQLIGLYGKRTE